MASVIGEAAVLKICEIAVEMTIEKLARETNLVVNFRKDFKWLNNQLTYIRSFLQDADEQSRQKEALKQWLENIRDIALHAEDVVEECDVESVYGNNSQSACGLSCNQLIFRYRMGRKIKVIKDCIRSVIEEGNQLKLSREVLSALDQASPSTSQRVEWKRSSLLPSDARPVGIEPKVQSMISFLDNPAIPIIAVVGMGGIGKTYLLQQVFSTAKQRYERSIWLSVSQFYSVFKLQCDIASHLGLSEQIKDSGVSEERAAELIHGSLEGKRCLIVLDDVWRATGEDNLIARLGLLTGNNSPCKIVVTTRSRDVCVNLNAEIYEMEYLSDEESWRLFCAYAFRHSEGNRPPQHLKAVARDIVEECGKLPLAIKTIGASLSSTRLLSRWESKFRQLKRVSSLDDPIMDILKLSYNSLPARLKACFAYLSFFPEDEEINCEYLLNLWVGEGFIPAGEGQWDMAWDCLYQLANLCLLQVWESCFLIKYCKIHDLLLDLAINISKNNKCAFSLEDAFTKFPSMDRSGGLCRILLGKKVLSDAAITESSPVSPRLLRTISLCDNWDIKSIPASLFSSVRVLRVLDLSNTKISTLPECVGKMKLLKVLNLRGTEIEEVPKCVRHLKSLSFLDISNSMRPWVQFEAPVWISELKCLQHLHCDFQRMPDGTSQLVSLRTLRSNYLDLSVEEDEFLRLENVGNVIQLEELWINVNHESELQRIKEGILVQLVKMRRLEIYNKVRGMQGDHTELVLPHLPEIMKAMKDLEQLSLFGFAVPSWICSLENLRELRLYDCHCSNYPELQTMPNLLILRLVRNKNCRELPKAFGESGGFPQLRFLTIWNFFYLEEFPELEDAAMACLEELELCDCPRVKKVGEGLQLLKALKEFRYGETGTDELRERLKEGGDYWGKIKAIKPQLKISSVAI